MCYNIPTNADGLKRESEKSYEKISFNEDDCHFDCYCYDDRTRHRF